MSIPSQPTNINFLSQTGFRFMLTRAPNINYFCQSATVPGFSLDVVQQPNPFNMLPLGGTKLDYDPLEIKFKVDEDMVNYLEIFNWMNKIAIPDNFEQYDSTYRTDATMTILTSHKNANIQVKFKDVFPISLSGLTFQSDASDVDYLEATVTFKYLLFEVNKL